MRKAWIWTNRGFLVFPGNLRVMVRVGICMVCIGDPWFAQAIHGLYRAIHGLFKSALRPQHMYKLLPAASQSRIAEENPKHSLVVLALNRLAPTALCRLLTLQIVRTTFRACRRWHCCE